MMSIWIFEYSLYINGFSWVKNQTINKIILQEILSKFYHFLRIKAENNLLIAGVALIKIKW